MAEATLTPVNVTLTGANITAADGTAGTADGAKFLNSYPYTFLVLDNASVGSLAVSITGQVATTSGVSWANKSLTIPASKTYVFGPIDKLFNDASSYAHITFPGGSESSIKAKVVYI